jgi:hypothetical protein
MKPCTDCGQPITRGTSSRNPACRRCLVCETKRLMRDFYYPASAEGQRAWRKAKEARRVEHLS